MLSKYYKRTGSEDPANKTSIKIKQHLFVLNKPTAV